MSTQYKRMVEFMRNVLLFIAIVIKLGQNKDSKKVKGEVEMIQIRPVSDLRNKFPEIETLVNSGNPVYLTKNGYGAMVVLSLEEYASLTDNIEMKLDEADRQAAGTDERLSHESVFKNARSAIHGK